MAAETEGIALLSMYGDDEEEEEAAAGAAAAEETAATAPAEDSDGEDIYETQKENLNKSNNLQNFVPQKSPHPFTSPSPRLPLDGAEIKTLMSPSRHRTPTPLSLTSPSPQRARRSALAIVDYAQDEMAASPEAEVMETEVYGRVIFEAELNVSVANSEGTTPVTSQLLTQLGQQEPFPPFDIYEQSKFEATILMEVTGTESEVAEVKDPSSVSTEMQIDKQMQNFLPPTVMTKCHEDLQEKINKFLAYKRAGKSFNADLRNRKDYRNPNFLQHAVSYQDIDEIGTCFSKEVFDPHGYDRSDYHDEIEADLKRELERREQERKKSQKIDLVSGCTQLGVVPASKTNSHVPASGISSFLSGSLPPTSTTGDAARDSRTNKKSKWDKVDGDAKIPLPSGEYDNPSSVNVNASHLSAANAGTGYSAFAQLKRREAEERKSNERKFDKRS